MMLFNMLLHAIVFKSLNCKLNCVHSTLHECYVYIINSECDSFKSVYYTLIKLPRWCSG
jgi:hypothetical protein